MAAVADACLGNAVCSRSTSVEVAAQNGTLPSSAHVRVLSREAPYSEPGGRRRGSRRSPSSSSATWRRWSRRRAAGLVRGALEGCRVCAAIYGSFARGELGDENTRAARFGDGMPYLAEAACVGSHACPRDSSRVTSLAS
jgi:hypothetical protein